MAQTEASAELGAWLMQQGLEGASQEDILDGYCSRLVALGVPLMRLHVAQSAFHPKYGGLGFEWHRGAGMSRQHYQFTDAPLPEWVRSPFYYLLEHRLGEMRARLDGGETETRFPMFADLRAQGGTDYFAFGLLMQRYDPSAPVDPVNTPEGLMTSWTSDRAEGFTDADLDLLRGAQPVLGLALKSAANRQMARDLLRVYLGRDAGRRVMSGEIQRGSLQQIDAVICTFDLSGFTSLSEKHPGNEMIAMLNDYFGVAVEVIQHHGGQVLKFMGDGVLAIFDLGDLARDAAAALDAASDLRRRMQTLRSTREAQGKLATGFTLALHAGEVLYGNIGAENRLDFTVIGPAVNQTARIGELHRSVGQNVIVSEDVRQVAGDSRHDLVSLGRYMLRGVVQPMELFTIWDGQA